MQVDQDVTLRNSVPDDVVILGDSGRIVQVGVDKGLCHGCSLQIGSRQELLAIYMWIRTARAMHVVQAADYLATVVVGTSRAPVRNTRSLLKWQLTDNLGISVPAF